VKLLMTLLVRNEADIVRQNIEFHLRHGVDHIVATDNASTDGTTDILREYEDAGCLTLLHEPSMEYRQAEWVTRMALLGRDRFGAEWIINNDADEFWCPADGSLRAVVDGRTEDALVCHRRNMIACTGNLGRAGTWADTLVYRVRRPLPWPELKDPMVDRLRHPYFYFVVPNKLIIRAKRLVRVGKGGHTAEFESDWTKGECDVTIYHFPVRSKDGFERTVRQIGEPVSGDQSLAPGVSWKYRRWYRMLRRTGSIDAAFAEVLPGWWRLKADLLIGRVVRDRSMRQRLAAIGAASVAQNPTR
jgi:hypothetical protein